jgi:FAD/FMN-containing dehydrogenase
VAYTTNRRAFLKAGGAAVGAIAAGHGGLAALAQGTAGAGSTGGEQVFPSDPRFADLAHGFNQRWVGSPAYVALCSDAGQVAQAVQLAVDDGLRVTARSGGHCYEDFSSGNDGGVIVDLSPMAAVWRDEATGMYGVEPGARLLDVYTVLSQQYGVTIPGGSCSSVGAGGHVTGGGYGLLSRLHGLTVDYLHAVELVHVTKDGRAEVVTVSRDSSNADERDLLWGHQGGGGGNFGIVTKLMFSELPAAPAEAHVFFHAFDWSSLDQAGFRRLLQNYGNFMAEHSGTDSPYAGLFPLLALSQKAAGQIGLTAQYVGDEPERLEEFARVVSAGLPAPVANVVPLGHHRLVRQSTEIQTLPWLDATRMLSGTGPSRRGKYKSAYMLQPFPDEQIDVIWEFLVNPDNPNPNALLQVDGYGGQINAVDPAATAVPQRSSILKLQYQTYWTDAAEDDIHLDWIRSFYTAMYGDRGPVPDDVMDGCYVNYPDADLEHWPALYYKDNYARLQRVKARWDPLDVFHHRQSIALPGDGESATPSA